MRAQANDGVVDPKLMLIKKLRAMLRERDGELSHLRRRLVELEGAGSISAPPPELSTTPFRRSNNVPNCSSLANNGDRPA
jgi:hypothetical protein